MDSIDFKMIAMVAVGVVAGGLLLKFGKDAGVPLIADAQDGFAPGVFG